MTIKREVMFIGTNSLKMLLDDQAAKVVHPYNSKRIKNGSYELSLGGQVYLTDSKKRSVKYLFDGEKIEIKPGQFALLLTKEYVKIPKNKIAFISIKAGIKFKGLVKREKFNAIFASNFQRELVTNWLVQKKHVTLAKISSGPQKMKEQHFWPDGERYRSVEIFWPRKLDKGS